jgi:hypothetical protein
MPSVFVDMAYRITDFGDRFVDTQFFTHLFSLGSDDPICPIATRWTMRSQLVGRACSGSKDRAVIYDARHFAESASVEVD